MQTDAATPNKATTRINSQQHATSRDSMQQGVQMDAAINNVASVCHGAMFGGKKSRLFTILAMSDQQASLAV